MALLLELISTLLYVGIPIVLAAFIVFLILLRFLSRPHPTVIVFPKEKNFVDPKTGEEHAYPSLWDDPTIDLSVIVPAFDEEVRLPSMLDECLEYLEQRQRKSPAFRYELVVVSDGSRDGTVKVALEYTRRYGVDKVRVLDLQQNRGKGGAVRLGMFSARGKWLLFADADGATRFSDYDKLEASLLGRTKDWREPVIVCGSRAHLEQEAIATRSAFRTFLMHGFHFLVWLFAVRGVRDTQCGFKVLTRSAARLVFPIMHVERWAFDVEMLFIAQHHRVPVEEIAVNWTEIDGSKVTPFWSWLQMGCDLLMIWLRYSIGAWSLKPIERKTE